MKKTFLLVALLSVLVACETHEYTTIQGDQTNWKIIELKVGANDWEYTTEPDNNLYIARFDVPELNNFVYNSGLVFLFQEFVANDGSLSQIQLPNSRHFEEFDNNGNQILYTETTDFEFFEGGINVYVTYSDFFAGNAPGARHYVLKMIW